jgi:hypothetical protein
MPAPTGQWIHSREEDHDGVEVYRRPDFPFPPARGREGLRFDPDGGLAELAIGRGDATEERPGSWRGEPGGPIRVAAGGRAFEVVSVGPDRLELRPVGTP